MFKQYSLKRAFFVTGASLLLIAGLSLWRSSASTATEHAVQADATPDWKSMSRSEKKDYMRNDVTPQMEHIFAKYDANKYGHVKCTLCHAEGSRTGTYKMPDAKLPKIPKDEAGLAKLEKKKPSMVRFMRETVSPEMAKMLGVKKYDCTGCHKTK